MRSFCTSAPAVRISPPSGTVPGRPALAAVVEPAPVRRLAGLDPGLAEDGVAEGADRLVRALRRLPCPGDPLPAEPADRRVERREVEADRRGVGRRRRRPPLAALEHRRLVVLGDRLRRSPRRRRPRSRGLPFSQRSRSNFSHCDVPQCGQATKYRRWSEASYSRSIRESPRIVGVEARNTLRRCAKVSDRASASETGSPSSSAEAG